MTREVLLLGDPALRKKSHAIGDFEAEVLKSEIDDLKCALEAFRAKNGFGRGIAAIQIGIPKRMIALNLGQGVFILANPVITFESPDSFSLWDDCMSFPDLVVRVARHKSIGIEYRDEFGNAKSWKDIGQAEAELLQHEIDHLDGVLAIDRAIGKRDILYKNEYNKHREYYESLADYRIQPTIASRGPQKLF